MTYILLHINEFNYLIFSGGLRTLRQRLINVSPDTDEMDLFRSVGYLKYSSPESYIFCEVDSVVHSADQNFGVAKEYFLEMSAVRSLTPLTAQAEVLLRPVIHRARLLVSPPMFESAWQRFVDEEILRERHEAAVAFVKLFSCRQLEREAWNPAPGLFEFMLKDLGPGLNEIERRSRSAELGVFEFCVRLAHLHDAEWRRDDPSYSTLKQVRVAELANRSLSSHSFLNSAHVCLALRAFEEESLEHFGYSPFSLVPFFEFCRTHSRQNGINFRQIRSAIERLLKYGLTNDASDYAHLVGYFLGLDEVTPATYFIQPDRFSVFDNSSSEYPSNDELVIEVPVETFDPFEIPVASDVDTSSLGMVLPSKEALPDEAESLSSMAHDEAKSDLAGAVAMFEAKNEAVAPTLFSSSGSGLASDSASEKSVTSDEEIAQTSQEAKVIATAPEASEGPEGPEGPPSIGEDRSPLNEQQETLLEKAGPASPVSTPKKGTSRKGGRSKTKVNQVDKDGEGLQ